MRAIYWSLWVFALLLLPNGMDCREFQFPLKQNKLNLIEPSSNVVQLPSEDYRLPTSIKPIHYDIQMRPILEESPLEEFPQYSIPSNISILVECLSTTSNITLHLGEEVVTKLIQVREYESLQEITISNTTLDKEKSFVIISLQEALIIGQRYKISIDYIAQISTNASRGMYISEYETGLVSNPKRSIAITQLTVTGARHLFPCFEEPGLRATFNITVGSNLPNVRSNGKLIGSEEINELPGWRWNYFERTPLINPSLIAVLVSDYAYYTSDLESNFTIRIHGPISLIIEDYARFAAEVNTELIPYYEDFFEIGFSISKLDSIAAWDFPFAGKENWGLYIYQHEMLLYSPDTNTEAKRREIAKVIAHELAHEYFGNLVDYEWHTGRWLAEGFAVYFSYMIGMNKTTPEFDPLKEIVLDTVQYCLDFEDNEDSLPVQISDVGNPEIFNGMIWTMSYLKGAALIRMMEGFLTQETLYKALKAYLKTFSYQNVHQDDLFQILTEYAKNDSRLPEGITIKDIMDTWTLQSGYPLVRVDVLNESQIIIAQENFKRVKAQSVSNMEKMEQIESVWHIPISISTANDPPENLDNSLPNLWLSPTSLQATVEHNTSKWILINARVMSYYRVIYDRKLSLMLQEQLVENFELINSASRSQLINDYFTYAFQERIEIEEALEFTKYIGNELERIVWVPLLSHLSTPFKFFQGLEAEVSLKNYLLPKIHQVLNTIGFTQGTEERGSKVIFRSELMDWACKLGSSECIDQAANQFRNWTQTPGQNLIPLELREIFYCSVMATSLNTTDFEFLLERYKEERSLIQKTTILNGLSCLRNEQLLIRLLEGIIGLNNEISIDSTTALTVLLKTARNPSARPILLKFLEENINKVVEKFEDPIYLAVFIYEIGTYYCTQDDYQKVLGFVERNPEYTQDSNSSWIYDLALQTITNNISWMDKYSEPMVSWFSENN